MDLEISLPTSTNQILLCWLSHANAECVLDSYGTRDFESHSDKANYISMFPRHMVQFVGVVQIPGVHPRNLCVKDTGE